MTRLGLSSITEIKKGRRRGPTKRRKRGKKKTQPVNAGIPIKKEEDAAREEEDEVNKGAASVHCVDIRLIDHNGEETCSEFAKQPVLVELCVLMSVVRER